MHCRKLLLGFLFVFSLSTCKEEKDTIVPTVSISLPVENESFNVLDPVVIHAKVSDNETVESVRISLISEATSNQVLSSIDIQVNQQEVEINRVFELSDSLLETGSYYFRVEAFDGENYFSGFRSITINGIAKEKLGLLVSCSNGSNTTLYQDNNDFNFQAKTTFEGSHLGSVFNARDQQFWFVPSNGDLLEVYDVKNNTALYSERYLSNFSNAFSDLKLDNREVFIGLRNGEIDGRSHQFSDSYTYLAQSGRQLGTIAVSENYVLVEEADVTRGNRAIQVLRRTSGALQNSIFFSDPISSILFLENDQCLVFANDAQGGKAVVCDLLVGTVLNTLFTTDSIRSVIQTNTGDYVIATDAKVDYYSTRLFSLFTLVNTPNAILAYDTVDDYIYIGAGNQLEIHRVTGQIGNSIVLPDVVQGISIWYNRD